MDMSRPAAPEIEIKEQVYAWLRAEPYRRRDGTETVLNVYRSGCAKCGQPFEVKVSPAGHRYLNRRCAEHRRPGSRA